MLDAQTMPGTGKRFVNALHLSSSLQVGAQPLETLVETVTAGGTRGLDEPLSLSQAVQAELVGNLGGVHGVGQILLVSENEQQSIAELILVEHALQFLARFGNSLSVVRVDDEDDTVRVLEVVPPERSDLVLSSNVPYSEGNVLVLDSLDVEACSAIEVKRQQGKGIRLPELEKSAAACCSREPRVFAMYLPMVGIVVTISPSLSL